MAYDIVTIDTILENAERRAVHHDGWPDDGGHVLATHADDGSARVQWYTEDHFVTVLYGYTVTAVTVVPMYGLTASSPGIRVDFPYDAPREAVAAYIAAL